MCKPPAILRLLLTTAAVCLVCSACQSPDISQDYPFTNLLERPEFLLRKEPEPDSPKAPGDELRDKMAAAASRNTDLVGWLLMPGIGMDQPVVQTDNNDFYHRRGLDKQYRYLGILFADYTCRMGDRSSLSRNTVIYGHNLDDDRKTGQMFAPLINYDKAEFAAANRFITFASPSDEMTWVVFAAFYTDTRFFYIDTNPKDEAFLTLVREAVKRSEIITDVEVNRQDKILTLSTCTYRYGKRKDQRFVVMARLLRAGEKQGDFSAPAQNPDPKPPQF